MFFIDSHCHLTFSRFSFVFDKFNSSDQISSDREYYSVSNLLQRAVDSSVKYILLIGTELSDVEELRSLVDDSDHLFRTVGIHPLEAKKHRELYSNDDIISIITSECAMVKTVGIGEIGLDYHYEKASKPQQKELFHLQLELAKRFNLPVSIHSREAYWDVIDILKDHPGVRGVIHCFSGEMDFATAALDLGFFISISGIITYKNVNELRETLKYVPLDSMLLETDAPFLAPMPYRGQLNEPSFIPHIAQSLAQLLGVSATTIAECTSSNFSRLFSNAIIS
ncbi:MAG: TatD family hydrolase [Holosporaceae bacterium]|jgi:TatD DNase family protein|nr:TatD family hydrolase [Holosporaceae bacterium]